MVNVLSNDKREQVLALGRLGWSLRRIEEATSVRRETAATYLRAAGIRVRGRGRPPTRQPRADPTELESGAPNPAISAGVSTDSAAGKPDISGEVSTDSKPALAVAEPSRAPSASACESFRDVIEAALARGRNAVAIWQDLVDRHGFAAGYASVRRFVLKVRGSRSLEPCGVITTAPGQESQVDYGDGPMVRHPNTGKYRRARMFVLTLGYSRKAVRLLVWRSTTRTWAELHERAFRRLGGSTRVVVLDNLREGVLKPDVYDPKLNPLYRDLLKHYGAVALPCRVKDPDRKGKVESGVGHAQRTPLKGLRFESLEEAQRYLDHWEQRWADTRIHGTTKRQVTTMFAEEKPALLELPLEPFRYYSFGKRTVNLDGCVEVAAAYYGAPRGWIGRELQVRWDELHVRILHPKTEDLLREHLRTRRGFHCIEERDKPARTPQSTEALLRRAHGAGTHIGTLCEQIHRSEGEAGVRRILGVLALARKYGVATTEEAALAALEMGAPTYRFLRRYLERRPPVPLTLRQVDPLIRQLTLYRELIDQKAGDPA
jgi:transposase